MDFSLSGDGQREGDGERSSLVQSASAFDTLGKSQSAGSQENTLDDEIKQYTRVQIVTLENEQSPPQQQRSSPTSSYWSVPEQTDFYNLLRYFGTDWHAIARSIKTKTHVMVIFPLPSTAIRYTNRISRSNTFITEKSRKASLVSI